MKFSYKFIVTFHLQFQVLWLESLCYLTSIYEAKNKLNYAKNKS